VWTLDVMMSFVITHGMHTNFGHTLTCSFPLSRFKEDSDLRARYFSLRVLDATCLARIFITVSLHQY
jgi:hypothetical protein